MCLLIESQCSKETNRQRREGERRKRKEGGSVHKQCLLKAPHRLISINSSDFRKLIFCHWTVLYYLWLKWKPGNAAAMEERCIANDVAYASLHNQHLGKQQIKRSTGREKNESKMLYPHISLLEESFWRRPGEHCGPFDAAGLHLQVLLSMKVWCGAESRPRCNFSNVDLKKSGQNKHAVAWEHPHLN